MKTAALVVTILVLLILTHLAPIQGQMACGQGVVMRSNGIIVVDGWTGFDTVVNMTVPQTPTVTSPPTGPGGGQVKAISYPSQVAFGASVQGTAKVCIESDNGSQCKTLAEVRTFIRGK